MKRKTIVAAALTAACLLIAAAVIIKKTHRLHPQQTVAQAPSSLQSKIPPQILRSLDPNASNPSSPFMRESITTTPGQSANPEHEDYVDRKLDDLYHLGLMNDEASREAIMAELANPESRIRDGALIAIKQFGDRSVIPRLQEIAAQTEDPFEQKKIIDAIEFLKLPSLTEVLAEQEARKKKQGK